MKISESGWLEVVRFVRELGDPQGLLDSPHLRERLEQFLQILERKNEEVNLTALKDPESVLWKHIADSLALVQWESLGRVLDWGSGGGFPGIPLALARQEKGLPCNISFLDSVGKKVRAIEEFCGALGISGCEFHHSRGEDLLAKSKGFDTVVMRAVAPADRAAHWLNPSVPRWVFLLGPQQLDLWLAQGNLVKKMGFAFGKKKIFSLPHDMGARVLLEIVKR